MKPWIPQLLSLNAGYVDTAGFMALQGLFTAHVTGNFVTLGAALVQGSSGVVAKLLALPVFCAVIVLARVATASMNAPGGAPVRAMMAAKLVLLTLGAILAIALGPFTHGDSLGAIATGMVLVAAMAIQNTLSRAHLATSPPTTLMTGSTTQLMIDVADLLRGAGGDAAAATRARLRKTSAVIAVFAVGCALGAVAFHFLATWCFAVPPLVALVATIDALASPPQA